VTLAPLCRFVWDLHYPPPKGGRRSYPIAAIYRNTPSMPMGPWVLPGGYVVRLTVGDSSQEQPLTVAMDPRVKTPAEGLARQFALSMDCCEQIDEADEALARIRKLWSRLAELREKTTDKGLLEALQELEKKTRALEGTERRRGERPAPGVSEPSLAKVMEESHRLLSILQGADAAPTTQAVAACGQSQKMLRELLARKEELLRKEVKPLSERLRQAGLPALEP